ncbi:amino acid aminotransferase [Sphingosinicella sp. LY1275]|uniref:amino acid aminotransferase n=1 Tax=Sphingosinicella sp. LY1275 TaxID=3095379 RepID=UPI002ADEAA24|nr:amino acid aminotransferase [Sphingosinicella sp. LY1275]MEA1013848.1 amino acid aminotransferase [Sphingosinicella sp. LY1275]
MTDTLILDTKPNLFDSLKAQPADALLAIIGLVNADPRPEKMDLGVGVYKDAAGNTPILRAVKAAEKILLETQETKAYLGSEGDVRFVALIKEMAFGPERARDDRIVGLQTPGGCGALRLGAELIKATGSDARIFVGQPTWPNHTPLIGSAGVPFVDYPYYDKAKKAVLFDRMMAALEETRAGDIVLVHGCCHNPTGADLSLDEWKALADIVSRRGLVPLVDLAYQGLGNGLEADAAGMRVVVDAADQALVAHSNDKNFGLYRERTGSLFVKGSNAEQAKVILGNLAVMARTSWSMPPDHGAAVVRTVLDTPELDADWHAELDEMLARIRHLRARIAAFDPRLAYIDQQNGMFSMLPLSPEQVADLREKDAIYMAGSGRFNVAGLSDENVDRFAAAVAARLPE